jgi:hypothetical protein
MANTVSAVTDGDEENQKAAAFFNSRKSLIASYSGLWRRLLVTCTKASLKMPSR